MILIVLKGEIKMLKKYEVLVSRSHYTWVYAMGLGAAMDKAAEVLGVVKEDGMLSMPDGSPVAVLETR